MQFSALPLTKSATAMYGTKSPSSATLAAPIQKGTLSFLRIETALEDRNYFYFNLFNG
jgi:hypothetical protein